MDVTTSYSGQNIAAAQNRPTHLQNGQTPTIGRPMTERPAAMQAAQPNILASNMRQQTEAANGANLREENITDAMLEQAFEDANRALRGSAFSLSYGVHEGSNRIMVTVHESHSREVLRQIPMESRLDIYARITEFVGLLFDQGK